MLSQHVFARVNFLLGSKSSVWYAPIYEINILRSDLIAHYKKHAHTLTNWFSTMFLPFTRSTQAFESKSNASTVIVKVVRTRLLVLLPVFDSTWTYQQNRQEYFH